MTQCAVIAKWLSGASVPSHAAIAVLGWSRWEKTKGAFLLERHKHWLSFAEDTGNSASIIQKCS